MLAGTHLEELVAEALFQPAAGRQEFGLASLPERRGNPSLLRLCHARRDRLSQHVGE
jgi:hypothetical protein